MTKAYSYLRFSTPEQAKGDSFRRQTDAARHYADEHALELDTELTFQDLGVSAFRGANSDEGRLGDFRRAIEAGLVPKGSRLLVEALDRISRQTARRALRVLEDIIDRGVVVVTLADGRQYDARTMDDDPMALMWALMVFMRGHEESAMKSSRLRAVYEAKRKAARDPNSARPFTRRTPAWIKWDDATSKFQLIPERAEIIREIFKSADAGRGKQAIASALNTKGVKPFGIGEFWHKSYIEKILSNPACIGTFIPTRKEEKDRTSIKVPQEPIHGYFPSVVPQDLYERVVTRGGSAAPRGRHSGKGVNSIVAGIAKCGRCGASFVRVSKGTYTYLVCSRAHAKAGCEYLAVPYGAVEGALISHMETLVNEAPKGGATDGLDREIDSLNLAIETLLSDGEFMTNEFRRSRSPTIGAQIAALDDQLRARRLKLEEVRRRRDALASQYVAQRLETLQEAFKAQPFSVADANNALRACVTALEFNPKSPRIEVQWATGSWAAEGVPLRTRHEDLNGFDA